jgi:hypothetical protein
LSCCRRKGYPNRSLRIETCPYQSCGKLRCELSEHTICSCLRGCPRQQLFENLLATHMMAEICKHVANIDIPIHIVLENQRGLDIFGYDSPPNICMCTPAT